MRLTCLALLAAVVPIPAGVSSAADSGDERTELLERQAQLQLKIDELKREQAYLNFQKAMYSSDSKYLLLDLTASQGVLKYRNRTLRTFKFSRAESSADFRPSLGPVVLTAKADGQPRKRFLLFSNMLALHAQKFAGNIPRGTDPIRLIVGAKDIAALYYAVEKGSIAYIVR